MGCFVADLSHVGLKEAASTSQGRASDSDVTWGNQETGLKHHHPDLEQGATTQMKEV